MDETRAAVGFTSPSRQCRLVILCVGALCAVCASLLLAEQEREDRQAKEADGRAPESAVESELGSEGERADDPAPASGETSKQNHDDEIVVTASRIAAPVGDTHASVSVLKPSNAERAGVKSADDVLRRTPGIDVRRTAGVVTSFQRVSLRGMGGTQSRTLVLFDGIPQASPYAGTVDWNSCGLSDVDRIEVVRGPMSSLYGSNAMGGVINVISRRPEREFEVRQTVGFGDWNTFLSKTHLGSKPDKVFSFALDADLLDTAGYSSRPKELRRWYDIERKSDTQTYSSKLFFDFDDTHRLDIVVRRFLADYNFGRDLHYSNCAQSQGSIAFETDAEPVGFKLQTYTIDGDVRTVYDRTTGATAYLEKNYITSRDDFLWGASAQVNVRPCDPWRVTVGSDFSHGTAYNRDKYVSVQPGRRTRCYGEQDSHAWFLETEVRLFDDRLVLSVGGRHDTVWNEDGMTFDTNDPAPQRMDYDDEDKECFTPRGGLVLHIGERTTLRAGAGCAFRSPNIYDLYRTWRFGNTIYSGNPALGSEELTSYELGIEQWFSDDFRAALSHYQSFANDFIYSVTVGGAGTAANPTIRQRNNVGEVVMRGAELEVEHQVSEAFSWFANCTYSTSIVTKCDPMPELEGKTLDFTPLWKVAGGVCFEDPDIFDVAVTCRFVDERCTEDTNRNDRKVRDCVVVDLSLSRKLGEHFRLFFNADNIFDREYQETWENNAPGRFLLGGVEVEF